MSIRRNTMREVVPWNRIKTIIATLSMKSSIKGFKNADTAENDTAPQLCRFNSKYLH